MNAVLASRGYPTHPASKYRFFVGDGLEVLARRTMPDPLGNDEHIVRECAEQVRIEYNARWRNKSRLYPGIPELLDDLIARGTILAILSNKPHAFVEQIARHFFNKWKFASIQGALPDVPRKPDPASALAISRAIGLPPHSFLYLGDTNTDMQTAIAAGMFPVGALWGFRPAAELREAGARSLATHPRDVLKLL